MKESQNEIKDIQEGFQKERTEMLDMIRDLTKQYKLKMLIINGYIPQRQLTRIEKRATWDDEAGEWNVQNIHLAGNNL